eukprot:Trichotokara_eunicae@DN6240_c0_g1_i1.p2
MDKRTRLFQTAVNDVRKPNKTTIAKRQPALLRGSGTQPRAARVSPKDKWRHDRYDGPVTVPRGSEVFVRGLPKNINSRLLEKLFSEIGEVSGVKIEKSPSQSTAVIRFPRVDAAETAVLRFHKEEVGGSQIKVSKIETAPSRPSSNDDMMDLSTMGKRGRRVLDGGPGEELRTRGRTSIFERLELAK